MELFYKGYRTNVEFDEEEKYYYGKLEGIEDFVNFGTEVKTDIEKEFHSAVDDYLELCEEIGDKPNHETYLPVSSSLRTSLEKAAKNAGQSLNNFVEKILTDYLAKTA